MTGARRTRPAMLAALILYALVVPSIHGQSSPVDVLTQHNDNARTGANLAETALTSANVSPQSFGRVFTIGPVDGQVYAQPLVVSQLAINGAVHNVLIAATAHNTMYAFDADRSSTPLWQTNLGPSAPQDPDHDPENATSPECRNLTPEIGITSTPVIDRGSSTIYVVAKSRDAGGAYHQHLFAVSLITGQIQRDVEIAATVTVDSSTATFDPRTQLNRPGLLLANGTVYVAFGSHCDYGRYSGWVMGYTATTLQQAAVYNLAPTGQGGSVWQAGQGLAADASNALYFSTGNGATNAVNLSDSAVKLSTAGGALTLADWFTPFNWQTLNERDEDLGSAGVVLLPETHLLVGGGKEGRLYLMDRNNMGRFDPEADHVVQSFQATGTSGGNWIMGSPVYWMSASGGRLYVWGGYDVLKAFAFDGSTFNPTPIGQSAAIANAFQGGILSVSANGTQARSGVVWASHPILDAIESTQGGTLRAFDAEDVTTELWNSSLDPDDAVGAYAKFCPPTIANGKVYLATFSRQIQVYGLKPLVPPAAPSDPAPADRSSNVSRTPTLTWAATNAATYDVRLGTTSPPPTVTTRQDTASFTPGTLGSGTTYFWQIVAHNGAGTTESPVWSFTTVAAPTVPDPWKNQDVGIVGQSGAAHFTSGTFTVSGAGADVWAWADGFHFVYQPISGDGAIVARVLNLQNTHEHTKAGVMFRSSLDPASANVILDVQPTGDIEFMTRSGDGAFTSWLSGAFQAAPVWLELARVGTTIIGYVSTDGVSWTEVGRTDTALPVTSELGMVVTSHDTSALNTAMFDSVELTSRTVAPAVPNNPSPSNGATGIVTRPTLTWAAQGATSFDVNFGTGTPPPPAATGLTSASYVPGTLSLGTTYFWQAVARNGAGTTVGPVWSFTTTATSTLPAPWQHQDIGAVGQAGVADFAGGQFTISGAGADIWDTADAFQFVFQPVSGETAIVARVLSLQNTHEHAKAGVMLRGSLDPVSAHVILDVQPTGSIEFMTRSADGSATTWLSGALQVAPVWLKLTRAGATITGFYSTDGTTWTEVGRTNDTLPLDIDLGLVVTSHDASTLNTANVDSVAVTTSR